jgi:hypothetical protein
MPAFPTDSRARFRGRARVIAAAALIAAVTVVSGCRKFPVESDETPAPGTEKASAVLNRPFEIKVGDSRQVADTDLTIRFENVVEDNRCPAQVICIQNGRAGIQLIVEEPDTRESEVVMYIPGRVETPFTDNGVVFHRGRYFKLLRLSPYPYPGTSIPSGSYEALLEIDQPR